LMRPADADETYENEDALASCRRGSLGIGQVVELDDAGDVQYSQEQADEKRFALRKSPHAGEFGDFSIHASVTVHAADKDGRERLIRNCARPVLGMERMIETKEGLIAYRLRHLQKGRATHRVLTPVKFLARIAAIIPPSRHPLLRYVGVFGPHSSWRKLCVPQLADDEKENSGHAATIDDTQGPSAASTVRAATGTSTETAGNNAALLTAVNASKSGSPAPESPRRDAPSHSSAVVTNPWRLDWATLLKKVLLKQFGMSTKEPPVARARSPDWD
jgi:hypothetical protein